MAKVEMSVECFCGMSNKMVFKKPSAFVPTVEKKHCEDCDSDILYKFKKAPGVNRVSFDRAIVKCGDTLRLIMLEQQSST